MELLLLQATQPGLWQKILETLNTWDTWLFLKINNDWTSSFLDHFLPIYRSQNFWIPLYLLLLVFVFLNFGIKAWGWLVFVILTIVLSDQISSSLVKDFFNRPRPCNDSLLKYSTRFLLSYRPQSGSFTSSHATNHFAIATYFYITLKPYIGKWARLFFIWAATICYAQVYVGVHYPGDVIGGALLGYGIGLLTSGVFRKYIGMPPLLTEREYETGLRKES